MTKRQAKGIAIPLVMCCLVVATILVALILQRSSIETRVLDKQFDVKMAFLAAESGLNKAAANLISHPFYQRWYLKEAGEVAKGDKLAGVRALMSPHALPVTPEERKYLDDGSFEVWVVERHKKFPDEIAPKDPVADGFDPAVAFKVGKDEVSADVMKNRITNSKVSHVDIFSRGEYVNPATKQKSRCLLYGKFVVLPEPYAFEYDTNNDGKISYYGSGLDQIGKPDAPPVMPSAEQIADFQRHGNDYIDHPFLDKVHWLKYNPPDLLSQKPIIARVIKVRALYDKDLVDADLSKPETLQKIKERLSEDNLKFLSNFARNRKIVATFRDAENDKAFGAAADTTTLKELQDYLGAKGAGGVQATPDTKSLSDKDKNDFIAFAIKNFRYDEEGQAYHDLEFNIAENPLGSLEAEAKPKTLGKIFNLSSLNLDTQLVDDLKKGKITNGEQLLAGMHNQAAKPLSETQMSTAEYIKRLSAAIQEYAVVTYPIGKVKANHFVVDPNDPVHKPPTAGVTEWYEYEIGSEFEEALRTGAVPNPDSFYTEMAAEVDHITKLPTTAGGNDKPTASLSPRPPEKAENPIPVLLVNKKDIRLTTKFSNILAFYFKYIDFEVGTGKEDYLTADLGNMDLNPQYASRWKCKCLTVSKHAAESNENTKPSASHSAVAIGN